MAAQENEIRSTIITELSQKIADKIKGKQGKYCMEFAKRLFASIAEEDLQRRNIDDIYGLAVSFWTFISNRKQNESKLTIYNPDFEQNAWSSTHTIIQVVHDDVPFIVDSLRMELDRMGLTTHLTMQVGNLLVKRDASGQLLELFASKKNAEDAVPEAVVLFEIERITDPHLIHELEENLAKVLNDVRVAVRDWKKMRERVKQAMADLAKIKDLFDPEEYEESIEFLSLMEGGHFTFLGVREYQLIHEGDNYVLKEVEDSGLGVLHRSEKDRVSRNLTLMTAEARDLALSSQILIIAKTNTRSTVHRPVYTDYIGIKQFNSEGVVTGELRLIGTFDSRTYNDRPTEIPILRRKIKQVMKRSHLTSGSHAGKVLLNILETLPRDDLFQASIDDLLVISMGIYHLQERKMIRMFARKDIYGRFVSCLVFVPRDRFDTELRIKMQDELAKAFHSDEITFSTRFSESILARIHFVVRLDPDKPGIYDFKKIEASLIEIGRSWQDDLDELIFETYGEEQANHIVRQFKNAFPSSFREFYTPRTAVYDIKHIIRIQSPEQIELNFSRPVDEINGILRLKIYRRDSTIPLSDAIPILENLGLRIISERPYELKLTDHSSIWINDFGMVFPYQVPLQMDVIQHAFEESFSRVWFGDAENDGFNKLVLLAELDWREVMVLRCVAKYLRQIGFTFSQDYLEDALIANPYIAKGLVELFVLRFNVYDNPDRESQLALLESKLLEGMDSVVNLDEDRILRQYLTVIKAIIRTNYFQQDADGQYKNFLSVKIDSEAIPNMPLPRPMFEIFVYSPRFEAIHLRNGKVARGGLRWSDRREDFRTEVLGLMKAQRVKNAVIVPTGAKGGFVLKRPPTDNNRESLMKEGIACYQNFIRALLDITDNYKDGQVIKPLNVVCYDEDDTYLVVAADKGTATFSDIANEISLEYGFWLGDAFASGGSTGYDHKKMAITARGGWESVKRHFREMGIDTQSEPFTVVGIGDMSGDVFGNGLLLSRQIKMVAAFNHLSIFIDPNPNPETSFVERERLFNLPRSNWTDYNAELISKGGGIFDRKAKSIKLSPEIKQLLQIDVDFIIPNDLIQAILRAPVDLLWNGGIGTYVKATTETHIDVGDRTNDHTRINATELRCKVIGEGGNLGLTQLARVEYAFNGGRINTDFIDNSGGVDCSDHEVNIKILLDNVVRNGDLTEKQRNELLAQMTDEVGELVLADNYQQTQAISLAESLSNKHVQLHVRYLQDLESSGKINRSIEFLPDEKTLRERVLAGMGLLRPDIAVLLAYSKSILKDEILRSDVPEDDYLMHSLEWEFPAPLRKVYRSQMEQHPLKREIIATQLSNQMVNEAGFTFAYRLQDETGAPIAVIVRAYAIVRAVFNIHAIWKAVQALDNNIPTDEQHRMLMHVVRLIRRGTRWFIRHQRAHLDVAKAIEHYGPGCRRVCDSIKNWLPADEVAKCQGYSDQYTKYGVPHDLSMTIASIDNLFPTLDIVESAYDLDSDVDEVGRVYFAIGERLQIGWVREMVISYPVENHWEALSREALRDDLDWQQRVLTKAIFRILPKLHDPHAKVEAWANHHSKLIERWERMINELRANQSTNITMLFVATRELFDLSQTAEHVADVEIEIAESAAGE